MTIFQTSNKQKISSVRKKEEETIINQQTLIRQFQNRLNTASSPETKAWWEKYMKGVIPFRGVGIPKNRELLALWRKENGIDRWPLEKQLELALSFFYEPAAEDKLAGILYLQCYLYNQFSWEGMLDRYEDIYAKALIFDWNICDWFCVRVLGPTIKKYGRPCAEVIASWKKSGNLWQARSSVVAFVKLPSENEYYPLIGDACAVLIKREERFAKTTVGWILRDISKHDRCFVKTFIQDNAAYFTKESLGNALKYFEKYERDEHLQRYKK